MNFRRMTLPLAGGLIGLTAVASATTPLLSKIAPVAHILPVSGLLSHAPVSVPHLPLPVSTGPAVDFGHDALSGAHGLIGDNAGDAKEFVGDTVGEAKGLVGNAVEDTKEYVGHTLWGAQGLVGSTVGTAKGLVGSTVQTANGAVGQVKGIAGGIVDKADDLLDGISLGAGACSGLGAVVPALDAGAGAGACAGAGASVNP